MLCLEALKSSHLVTKKTKHILSRNYPPPPRFSYLYTKSFSYQASHTFCGVPNGLTTRIRRIFKQNIEILSV